MSSGNGHRRPTVPPGLGALARDAGAPEAQPPTFPLDVAAAQRAVSDLLVALGADPSSEHWGETPRRVADAYAEFLAPEPFDLASFPNDEDYDALVVARAIPVRSLCQHHLLGDNVGPKGVSVIVEADHTCMTLRGVRAHGSTTVTSALRGTLRRDARTRQELFSMAAVGSTTLEQRR